MRDDETGSWWQQVTGEAILGPLKGKRLQPVFHDELTFATWKREEPQGRVFTLVLGITVNGTAKAYPFSALKKQNPIIDTLGGVPLIIVLGDDGRSVRAFDRTVNGRKLEFFLKPNSSPERLVDESGIEWDFTGTAIGGSLAGKTLTKLPVLEDYWFDWKTYNPKTGIYLGGER